MTRPEADVPSRTRALVVLNPSSRRGTALAHFSRVAPVLGSRFAVSVVRLERESRWRQDLERALGEGVRVFIAAGGDGTVNALVNALDEVRADRPLASLVLGAVGLGSSNDFHKPVRTRVAGVPVRIDADRACPRDLVRVRYREGESESRRLFLVSASIGAVAAANGFFNRGDPLLRLLNRTWVDGAILYAALRTIAGYRNLPATLSLAGGDRRLALTNLSILKTSYLAGGLRYDTHVAPADGRFGVNLCQGLGRLGLIGMLANLARGRFAGLPGTEHWSAREVTVDLESPADLELDGEVVRAGHARFELHEERIRVCA